MRDVQSSIEDAENNKYDENPSMTDDPAKKEAQGIVQVGQYRCMSMDHLGSLCIDSAGMKFVTKVRSNEHWRMAFSELKSMRKVRYMRPCEVKHAPQNLPYDNQR